MATTRGLLAGRALAVVLGASLLLGACGGDDDSDISGDAGQSTTASAEKGPGPAEPGPTVPSTAAKLAGEGTWCQYVPVDLVVGVLGGSDPGTGGDGPRGCVLPWGNGELLFGPDGDARQAAQGLQQLRTSGGRDAEYSPDEDKIYWTFNGQIVSASGKLNDTALRRDELVQIVDLISNQGPATSSASASTPSTESTASTASTAAPESSQAS